MLVRCVPKSESEIHRLKEPYGNFDICPASNNLEKDHRHKPVPLKKTNSPDNQPGHYLEAKLPTEAVGFFLLTCNGPGYTVIPLNPGKRLYLVDEHRGFPPGLDLVIKTLQERDIWVVRSWLDVTRKIDAITAPKERRTNFDARWTKKRMDEWVHYENHCNAGRCSLPNTTDNRCQTFTEHSGESGLCRLLSKTPESLCHYVNEGLFFSGSYACDGVNPAILQAHAAAPGVKGLDERLTCVFCMKNSRFDVATITGIFQETQKKPIEAEKIVRSYLSRGGMYGLGLHDSNCLHNRYRDKPLVQIIDVEGNIRASQIYFIADPVQESKSNDPDRMDRSCPYIRVFVLHPHDTQKTGSLFVSHREITEIIHQENNRKLGEMINDSALGVSLALIELEQMRLEYAGFSRVFRKFEQKLQEATEAYQIQYTSSALCLELETYKQLWQQLPAPQSPAEQDVSEFLVNANREFCQLYAWCHLMSELISLKENTEGNWHFLLEPIIDKVALRRKRAWDYLNQSINRHSPSTAPDDLNMTRLAAPVSWEKLQGSNPCYRQICESGTEILAQLQKLTL
ncbi:hypothetical protein [Endozoicomonas sp. SESOKO1]|uniref:hypothetical protein n=1 Tax=Endozoicomonas sp. SESOKO1 TaxID=2828742 RepID=UPI002148C08E|nr:hypothetical protein [Endozoicomonas sp. SESOKO1]